VAISTTVSSGSFEYVFSGGTASDTTVLSGGTLVENSGAIVSGAVFSGGTLVLVGIISNGLTLTASGIAGLGLSSSSVAIGTTVSSGGFAFVSNGGIAIDTIVSGGGFEDRLLRRHRLGRRRHHRCHPLSQ
jgi:autotransporter passenger strand-loop-strand repeat protein